MSQADLTDACDRLSHTVDGIQFERLRWARTEGPVLSKLAELTQTAFEGRFDFELTEEGSTGARKRWVLKVHTNRIVAIAAEVADGRATILAEEIDRSRYRLEPGPPLSADFAAVDEAWVSSALGELLGRIKS